MNMAQHIESKDRTARLILGVILVLIALPASGMLGFGMMYGGGYGMMGGYGMTFGGIGFGIFALLVSLGILILGIYLIIDGLR